MSWVRIWVHIVFATKNREPFLSVRGKKFKIFDHIRKNADEKNILLDCIHGHDDHVHILISLGKSQQLDTVVQLIKGESSKWINETKLFDEEFYWQDDYWGVSVSESHLNAVRSYIYNQEKHHNKVSFDDEINKFMSKYGWVKSS